MQINTTVNGIASLQDMRFPWDAELREYSFDNLKNVDAILLGSRTAGDLIPYWRKVAEDIAHEDHELGKRITETPKIVFSGKIAPSPWPNTTIVNGPLRKEIQRLKAAQGNEMLVYGSIALVSSLLQEKLIDEFDLLVNPEAIGQGRGIFDDLQNKCQLKYLDTRPFSCGVTLLRYRAKNIK